jgi:hypothetical protein
MAGGRRRKGAGKHTLDERIQGLKDEGFTAEFIRRNGQVLCRNCSSLIRPEDLPVVAEHRFPAVGTAGGEAVLQAVTCPRCRATGQMLSGRGTD